MMKIVILNGAERETHSPNIATLIAELGFSKSTVLVEHNGTALRRDEWDSAFLREGDRVELMRLAAGG